MGSPDRPRRPGSRQSASRSVDSGRARGQAGSMRAVAAILVAAAIGQGLPRPSRPILRVHVVEPCDPATLAVITAQDGTSTVLAAARRDAADVDVPLGGPTSNVELTIFCRGYRLA